MERTGKYILPAPLFLGDTYPSMTTGIQESAEPTVLISSGEYRCPKIIQGNECTWPREITGQSDQLRVVQEEHIPLFGGNIRTDVSGSWHSVLDTGIDILAFIPLSHQLFEDAYLQVLFHDLLPFFRQS
jgi:hypothetical protein